jgi:hypothetical protein
MNRVAGVAKPVVGILPSTDPLRRSTNGKQYFSVELLVGDDKDPQLLLPFCQYHPCRELSIDNYIATLGLQFQIRVRLARPRQEGALYGARVYIDKGAADRYTVYQRWGSSAPSSRDEENCTIDTAEADHYFWFPVGETEHVIKGFFKSATESRSFVFAKPSRKRKSDDVNFLKELEQLGIIRIAFSSVVETIDRTGQPLVVMNPKRANVDEKLDYKIKIVAAPGKTVRDGVESTEEAVLSNEVIFERRLVYNTFEGLTTLHALQFHTHKTDFYKGMPLNVLLQKSVRLQAIIAFFRRVGENRVDLSTATRLHQASEGEAITAPVHNLDAFARVEDIVHYICRSVSPAASYIICNGKEKKGNYGEKEFQCVGLSEEKGLQDYADKERGLVRFFAQEPGTFDLVLDSIDTTRKPSKNYKVRFTVMSLDSDSDDD